MSHPLSCLGPVGLNRRNMLEIGGIGLLNLTLPNLLAAEKSRSRSASELEHSPTADSCILVFLNGGPSHLDMWDMKPDLPKEMRSEFSPIASTMTGVQVCEHLPKLAQVMDQCTLVRSVYHDQVAHAPAVYTALTGVRSNVRAGIMGAKKTDHPSIGSVLGRYRPSSSNLPYVLMPYLTAEGAGGPPQPGFLAGWLGKGADPLLVVPGNQPDRLVPPSLSLPSDSTSQRIQERRDLLSALNQDIATRDASISQVGELQYKALDLLGSSHTQKAFRIEQEPAAVRDRYGRNVYGQSMLLARRLIEAGTRLACISWAPDANATWDTHGDNFKKLKNQLLPPFDLGMTALLDDLNSRGLLERTLVVVMGEIGRTPKINGGAGRDHWEHCYSVLFAGGGMKKNFVYGASDRHGAYPSRDPVTAADIIATIYHALGLSAEMQILDPLNRPLALVPQGNPIRSLFA